MTFSVAVIPSKGQISLALIVTALALTSVLLADLDHWFTAACILSIAVSCLHQLFWAAGLHRDSIVQIHLVQGQWWLVQADGRQRKAELTGARVVLPWLVSAHFQCGRETFGCALFKDAMPATSHRLLRCALLMSDYPPQFSIQQASSSVLLSTRSTVSGWYQYGVGRLRRG